jgi:hypothetical protein
MNEASMAENETDTVKGDAEPLVLGEPEGVEPEVVPLVAPEPASARLDPPISSKRSLGFVGGVLGGLVAAGVGFGLAQYVPQGWPIQDTSTLQEAMTAQQKQTEALQAKLAELPVAPDLSGLTEKIKALDSRISALEARPAGGVADASSLKEMQNQIDALKSAPVTGIDAAAVQQVMAEAEAAATKIKADAEATAAKASAKLALSQIQAAVDSGAPFAASLSALANVPTVLTDNAERGLPTLAALTDSFPEAARAAIDAALRANMGESWSDRATNFLRTQTGARSIDPRDGNDPDAVLSRAEAALRSGNIKTALDEISALPEPAQAEMATWRAQAEKRQAGIDAVAGLAAAIGE